MRCSKGPATSEVWCWRPASRAHLLVPLQVVARGLHHLDSRALAALLKELAKV